MTYHPKSDFLATIIERGFLADCTNLQELDEAFLAGVVPAYIGYDATAKSLHVGHLLNIMLLRWFQKCGGKPITLMGGGTTKVGDPSFRADVVFVNLLGDLGLHFFPLCLLQNALFDELLCEKWNGIAIKEF